MPKSRFRFLFFILILLFFFSNPVQPAEQFVHGWMILDSDSVAVRQIIERAAAYGANHIQLSHRIIMNIDDILGDDELSRSRVDVLNLGIRLAHEHGMKAYIWAHEFSGMKKIRPATPVSYAADSPLWNQRQTAYRKGLAKIPEINGVIFMFGSAPIPPWRTVCNCCDNPNDPPQSDRIRLAVEKIGGYIVNELKKELFIRTFVHEPAEIEWHNQGLARAQGVDFTGMHKGPVQDWQPYNPHHPSLGNIGNHPAIMELDIAGECYGRSILPFSAPGYFRYRLNHLWENQGIGVVMRIQHNAVSALQTPNEINLFAITQLLKQPEKSLERIWDEALEKLYRVPPDALIQPVLKQLFKDTFPIRRKSHYVLGIWAHDKKSNFPHDTRLDQFRDRGMMPKWDPDWAAIWESLNAPDRQTVVRIWQEATEAVVLAERSLAAFNQIRDELPAEIAADLGRRFLQQKLAAEVFRAIDLFTWSAMAPEEPKLANWLAWARQDLQRLQAELSQSGFADCNYACAVDVATFLENSKDQVPPGVSPEKPDVFLFSPIKVLNVTSDQAEIEFSVNQPTVVQVDYGREIPDYGRTVTVGKIQANVLQKVQLNNLNPNARYVVQLRTEIAGKIYFGGDFWIFTEVK